MQSRAVWCWQMSVALRRQKIIVQRDCYSRAIGDGIFFFQGGWLDGFSVIFYRWWVGIKMLDDSSVKLDIFLLLSVKGWYWCVGGGRMVPYVSRWEIIIPWGARCFPAPSSCCFAALADGGEVCCCHLVWGVTWSYVLKARAMGGLQWRFKCTGLLFHSFRLKLHHFAPL